MAELKEYNHYNYDTEEEVTEVVAAEPVLTYPSKKNKTITLFERVIVGLVIVSFLGLAVLTVKLTTTISQAEQEIISIQRDIEVKTDEAAKLEQEKSELSRTERITKAAEDAGLEIKDENIRNVKK